MKNFNHLKEIWNQQNDNIVPDVSLIISKAKKEKKAIGNKIIIQTMILLMAVVTVCYVAKVIHFKMISSYIGLGIMIITIFLFSGIRLYQVFKLKSINLTQAPTKVLLQLNHFFAFQQFVNTTCMFIYFILLNTAFAFYFIETLEPFSKPIKILILILYISWIIFSYFVFGKKQIQIEVEKTQNIINDIKKIKESYENNS